MHKNDNVTHETITAVRNLNAYLMQIEKAIVEKAVVLDGALKEALTLKKEELYDYELDVKISFYNDSFDDPLWEKEDRLKNISDKTKYSLLDDGENHNEYETMLDHPFYGEFHCDLLRTLVTSNLDWDEILSISHVHWELIPRYQYCEEIVAFPKMNSLQKKALPIMYDLHTYNFYLPSVVEDAIRESNYPLDLRKFDRIAHNLSFEYRLDARHIEPLIDEELNDYHTRQYLLNVRSDKHTISSVLNLDVLKLVPAPMSNAYLIDPLRAMANGTIQASFLALEVGWAINLGGGFHHAHKNKGGGFCFFNDYALATLQLRKANPSLKILYIDLDAHLGDGVIEFATHMENFYIFDMYNTFQADLRTTKKSKDGRFTLIGIPLFTSDKEYLTLLKHSVAPLIDNIAPDFIFYNGGGDILKGDPLGKLAVSAEGLKQRDIMIFTEAKKRHIPIMMCLSGGYGVGNYRAVGESLEAVIDLIVNF